MLLFMSAVGQVLHSLGMYIIFISAPNNKG